MIYTIPPSSPIYYVTYVKIYEATPQYVYVGYTPGYLGTVVSPYGTVVYGTGYAYTPWIGSVWYPSPVTYGIYGSADLQPVGWVYLRFRGGTRYGGMAGSVLGLGRRRVVRAKLLGALSLLRHGERERLRALG